MGKQRKKEEGEKQIRSSQPHRSPPPAGAPLHHTEKDTRRMHSTRLKKQTYSSE